MTAMNPDRRPKQVHASDGRTGRRRGAQSETPSVPAGLKLESLNRTVSVTRALSNPDVLVLLGEDCCWQAATDDWRLRRPSPWRRTDTSPDRMRYALSAGCCSTISAQCSGTVR